MIEGDSLILYYKQVRFLFISKIVRKPYLHFFTQSISKNYTFFEFKLIAFATDNSVASKAFEKSDALLV